MKRLGFILVSSLLSVAIACTPLVPRRISQRMERPETCEEFLTGLDQRVTAFGVRDASSFPVPGFPYLRTNRFLSALKTRLKDDAQKERWVQWMQKLDLDARKKEISNLPDPTALFLASNPDRDALFSRVEACSSELLRHDQERPDLYEILFPLVAVPDEYSWVMRTLGVYPLFALPVAVVTEVSRERTKAWFETPLDRLPVDGRLQEFAPVEASVLEGKELGEILEQSSKNPLRLPIPGEAQGKRLVSHFAPVIVQDEAGAYDRIGRLRWKGARVEVDPERPTVYYFFSHAFLNDVPVLQINYVFWYSQRAGRRAPRIEWGHIDGLTVRISLDGEGKIFMVEAMNNCGCYHFLAPERARVDRSVRQCFQFDALVPQWLPTVSRGERLGLRVNSGWHQAQRLMATGRPVDSVSYELLPYELLEALPHEDGRTESIFDGNGIVKGSERPERFILFSMGILSIGSMRQRGHHAIELIGRTHFDDPGLFDRYLIFH